MFVQMNCDYSRKFLRTCLFYGYHLILATTGTKAGNSHLSPARKLRLYLLSQVTLYNSDGLPCHTAKIFQLHACQFLIFRYSEKRQKDATKNPRSTLPSFALQMRNFSIKFLCLLWQVLKPSLQLQ